VIDFFGRLWNAAALVCFLTSLIYSFCSKFDLYTKSSGVPDIETLKPYYQGLIDKYIPGKLQWWNWWVFSASRIVYRFS